MNKKNPLVLLLLIVFLSFFNSTKTSAQETENKVTATYLGIDEMRNTFIFISDKRSKLSFFKVEESVKIDLKDEKSANIKYLVSWVEKALNSYDANGALVSSQSVRVITGLEEDK